MTDCYIETEIPRKRDFLLLITVFARVRSTHGNLLTSIWAEFSLDFVSSFEQGIATSSCGLLAMTVNSKRATRSFDTLKFHISYSRQVSRPYGTRFTIYYLLPFPPPLLPPLKKPSPTGTENVIFILILTHNIEIQNVLDYYQGIT